MQNPEKEQLVIEINKAKPEDAEEINNVYYKTWLDTYPNEEIGITVEDIEDSFKDSFSKEYLDQVREKIMETTGKAMRLVAKKDDLIVGIGSDALVNKTPEEVSKIINTQIEAVNEFILKLETTLSEISSKILKTQLEASKE